MFAEVTFVEGLYSKHIIINLIYTPEQLSSQSIIRRNESEHRYTTVDGFGTQCMLMLPKAFHRRDNSKTRKTLKYICSHRKLWTPKLFLTGMKKSRRCQVCCRTTVIKTAHTGVKAICRPMEGSLEVNPHTDSLVVLTGMQVVHTEKNSHSINGCWDNEVFSCRKVKQGCHLSPFIKIKYK